MPSRSFKPKPKEAVKDQIPTPFVKAPSSLAPFLERLDPKLVHITHIDRTKAAVKKNIFLIPVLLNTTIAALLLWRLYHALPKYFILAKTILGYATSATVDQTSTTRKEQIWILMKRTLMMALDFLLFRFVGPWPLTFFFEQPANPCSYRWGLEGHFREKEVVVRVSRNWSAEDLMHGVKQGEENAFFKTRVLPAINPEEMRKTGYLMMNESWDLEFELMLDAHALIKQKMLREEDVDKMVFVYMEGNGWVMWKWEGEDVIEGRRKKVVMFKEVLTKLGKESLFWRWTEIVEEERDADGGFTAKRQERVVERVKSEFEKEGVDFEEIVKGIGGLDEVPAGPAK